MSNISRRALISCATVLTLASCARGPGPAATATGSDLLYVWTGDADEADADFLAVVDARPLSATYGRVLSTVPVDGRGNVPHHTEYEITPGRSLFANGWGTGRTFIFDLADAAHPKLSGSFAGRGGYRYPHSYARLPNGHVLATFQTTGDGYSPPGGLVELDERGEFVRAVSGAAPGISTAETWTYSLLVLPDLDRVVSTNTRMGLPAEWTSMMLAMRDTSHHHVDQDVRSTHIQIWRLSDLTLLHTLKLPPQEGGHEGWTAEPRRLANGEVFVNTFSCGLYHVVGVGGDAPSVRPAAFSRFRLPAFCAVPVVLGNFWIQPSATERAIVAYDLSDPATARVASTLALDSAFANPHWIAIDPGAPRIVVTSEDPGWVLLINVDPVSGALSIDERFRDAGAARAGLSFDRPEWPHGASGRAAPHGAVFARVSNAPGPSHRASDRAKAP